MRFEISEILKRDDVMNLVFGNCAVPKNILGRHYVKDGQVISAFHPSATRMVLILDSGERYEMDRVERQPIFALFLQNRNYFSYEIEMHFHDGAVFLTADPYSFESIITKAEEKQFMEGVWKDSYKKMGAHPMEIDGVSGTYFAVWAPNAKRVSVVGDFNYWDGLMYPMHRLSHTGIFELFIPGVKPGAMYKYEVKSMIGNVCLKSDPYGFEEEAAGDASYVCDLDDFSWDDEAWMQNRRSIDYAKHPMAICDISLGYKYICQLREGFLNEGYTHILLSENVDDEKKHFDFSKRHGVYAPIYCEKSSNHMRALINSAHQKNIGVLMEISLEFYLPDPGGLIHFDGTTSYGFQDDRIAYDRARGLRRFSYERKQVVNYLLSSMLFWMELYHIDGFVITNSAAAETLESAITFTKMIIQEVKAVDDSVVIIENVREEDKKSKSQDFFKHIGFDFYWNYDVKSSVDHYYEVPIDSRPGEHYSLSLPAYNSFADESILLLNHKGELGKLKAIMEERTGAQYDLASIRTMEAAYMLGLPGKKSWAYAGLEEPDVYKEYRMALLSVYKEYGALYESDPVHTPLEWVNPVDVKTGMVTYIRQSPSDGRHLLFVSNFSDKQVEKYRVGVPAEESYRLICDSDWIEFGGHSEHKDYILTAEQIRHDLKPYSIMVDIPPYTTMIFEFDM